MTDQEKKLLHDIATSVALIEGFVQDVQSFNQYSKDLKTKYDNVDDSIIWSIITRYLTPLKEEVNNHLSQ